LSLPVWPFNWKALLNALLSSVGPISIIVTKFWDEISGLLGLNN
jgi:hypothetical protein